MLVSPIRPKPVLAASIDPTSILSVIPTLNEAAHIEACIRSLMIGHAQLSEVSLIVADGGSTDETVAIVKGLMEEFPNLQLLNNPRRLQAAALNLAVRSFAKDKTRFLVRCDAHSIYPEAYILSVVASLSDKGAASLVVPMDAVGQTCFEKANAWIVDTVFGSGGAAHRAGHTSGYVDHGHHAGFDIEMFRSIDGYDESFSHNEDAEYDQRIADAGGKIYMDADIRVSYIPRGSIGRLAKQYFNYGKGRARNVAKHGQKLKLRQALPIFALLASIAGFLTAPFYWPALILPFGYVAVLGLASIHVALSKFSLCGLLAGLASGTMHMSWAAGFLTQSLLGDRAEKP